MKGLTQKKRILFILNPASGIGYAGKDGFESIIADNLNKKLFDYKISYTTSAEDAYEQSRLAAQQGFDIIAAVGGDGTANRVVKGMFGSDSVFAFIPVGSGNGLARYLNIPLGPAKSIALINNQTVRQMIQYQ